ncbi:hypothetical protein ACAW74_23075 [Fibrella sp. WM1]|uniref:hypothetical protein n=1 Tax=Fibrella musci TaxID=3242485 RepID=UPI00351FBDA1
MSTVTEGPVADLEKEVMALHDSIMPAMSELIQLRRAVAEKIAKATGPTKDEGLTIGSQLRQADDHMMGWMHRYKGDTLTKLSQDSALTYLRTQQAEIRQVRDQMKKSIAAAKTYTD